MKIPSSKYQIPNKTKAPNLKFKTFWGFGFNILYLFVICVLALVFSLSGCSSNKEEKLPAVKVARGEILAQLSTTGTVTPRNRLEINPPVAGRIDQVLVVEGQQIKKGQVLGLMSSSDRAALLDAAKTKGTAEVAYWENVYKPAPIVAALDGFVIKRNMEPGQTFSTTSAVLVMADRLIVEAQVDETDIGHIKVGQRVEIILDAYPKNTIPGRVEQIAYESETINNVNMYTVKVLPDKVPGYFRSGMSATINFVMGLRENVLTLPLNAVKKKNGRSYVFVEENGEVAAKPVQTGLENNSSVEVVSGIAEGALVVIPNAKIVQDLLSDNRFRRGPFNFLGGNKKK